MAPKTIPTPAADKITFVIHFGICPIQYITLDVPATLTQVAQALVALNPNGFPFGDTQSFQTCDNWALDAKQRKYIQCPSTMAWTMGAQVVHLNYQTPQADFVMTNSHGAMTSIARTGATVNLKFKSKEDAQDAVEMLMEKYEMVNAELLAEMEAEEERQLQELQAKKAARAKMLEKLQSKGNASSATGSGSACTPPSSGGAAASAGQDDDEEVVKDKKDGKKDGKKDKK